MFAKLPQPLPPVRVIRILVGIIVILAFLAGWYHSAWKLELEKNAQWQKNTEQVI